MWRPGHCGVLSSVPGPQRLNARGTTVRQHRRPQTWPVSERVRAWLKGPSRAQPHGPPGPAGHRRQRRPHVRVLRTSGEPEARPPPGRAAAGRALAPAAEEERRGGPQGAWGPCPRDTHVAHPGPRGSGGVSGSAVGGADLRAAPDGRDAGRGHGGQPGTQTPHLRPPPTPEEQAAGLPRAPKRSAAPARSCHRSRPAPPPRQDPSRQRPRPRPTPKRQKAHETAQVCELVTRRPTWLQRPPCKATRRATPGTSDGHTAQAGCQHGTPQGRRGQPATSERRTEQAGRGGASRRLGARRGGRVGRVPPEFRATRGRVRRCCWRQL